MRPAALFALSAALALFAPHVARAGDDDSGEVPRTFGDAMAQPVERDDGHARGGFEESLDRPLIGIDLELVGAFAAEGTIGIGVGYRAPFLPGLAFHGTAAFEVNPAFRLAVSARYIAELGDFRPYLIVGTGIGFLWAQQTRSTFLYAEAGHSFRLGEHTRLMIGAGFRATLDAWAMEGSTLLDGTTDPDFLEAQLDATRGSFSPVVSLRFAREL